MSDPSIPEPGEVDMGDDIDEYEHDGDGLGRPPRRITPAQLLSGFSMLLVAVAAFMPWVSARNEYFDVEVHVSGMEGDGAITLILACVGLLLLVLAIKPWVPPRTSPIWADAVTLIPAVLVIVTGLVDWSEFAGIGLVVTIGGGIAWLVGAFWQLVAGERG
jgi:hypothetical protein